MSESFQHGSRDDRDGGESGDRPEGRGTGRDVGRSGPARGARSDAGRRGPIRGEGRQGDRAGDRGGEGHRGGRGGSADRDQRTGDRRDERRGGYGQGRPGDDRVHRRGGEGYRGRRDDGRDGFAGRDQRTGDRRDERRGGYGQARRRDDRRDDRADRRGGEGYRGRGDDAGGGPAGRDQRAGDRRGGFDRGDRRSGDRSDRRRDDRRDDRAGQRGGYGQDRRRDEDFRGRGDGRSDASTHRHRAPEIDEDVTGRELDKPTRAQLGALEPRNAEAVARHLVMAGRYLLDDPVLALEHAQAAGRRGGRIAAVREATGIAAYEAGDYALALKELRTFRRMTGAEVHLPLMVDCERALGRVDKAVELATSEAAGTLEPGQKVELAIVLAGMRRDRGDAQGAVEALTIPQLDRNRGFSYSPRLFRAYAEALRGVGRAQEALVWERQAVVAEAALGLGQFAEPEIIDLDDEDDSEQVPPGGVDLTDAAQRDAAPEALPATAGDGGGGHRPDDGTGDGPAADMGDFPDDEAEDVLDAGAEVEPDDDDVDAGAADEGSDGRGAGPDSEDDDQGGSEPGLDPDDDGSAEDPGTGGPGGHA